MAIMVKMDALAIDRAIARVAHEILERNKDSGDLIILGIPTRGRHIAERLKLKIEEIEGGAEIPFGTVDATLYRDDLGLKDDQPALKEMDIPVSIDSKIVVLVDDVLYTGRTIRAAMNALMDFGRPTSIQLAVLVDRGHRELPIKADYVGKNLPTSADEEVKVFLTETDDASEVQINAIGDRRRK